MAPGQKRVDLVTSGGEREGVRAFFSRDASELLHRSRVDDVNDARVAHSNIEATTHAIEKHDVRLATQRVPAQNLSGSGIKRYQLTCIAGAKQAMSAEIEVQSMRSTGGTVNVRAILSGCRGGIYVNMVTSWIGKAFCCGRRTRDLEPLEAKPFRIDPRPPDILRHEVARTLQLSPRPTAHPPGR